MAKKKKITTDQLWALLSIANARLPVLNEMLAETIFGKFAIPRAETQGIPTFRWGDVVESAPDGVLDYDPDTHGIESWRVISAIAKHLVGKEHTPVSEPQSQEDLELALVQAVKFLETEYARA